MSDKMFKVVYNQSTKKLKINEITTYEELVNKIKSAFKKLTGQFNIYYYNEEGQRFDIQSEDDYEGYLEEEFRHKLFIKKEEDEYQPFQNMLNASSILNGSLKNKEEPVNHANNNMDKILETKLGLAKPEVKSEVKAISKISQIHKKVSQTSNVKSQNNTIKELIQGPVQPSKKQSKIVQVQIDNEQAKPEVKKNQAKKMASQIKKQQKKQQKAKVTKSSIQQKVVKKQQVEIKKPSAVHKISCNGCKSTTITGNRWRSLQGIDIDFCDNCYKNRKTYTNHEFVMMDTEDYGKKINYRTSIYQLFNPNYKPQKSKNRQITPWISQDDIIQMKTETVSEIWKASDGLSRKMLEQFEQWNQNWQISSKQ